MNYLDITSRYNAQPFRGGLLGLNLGGASMQPLPSQFAQLFNYGQQQFPQYGGNSRSAQMMNNYMGGLLSRRQGYQPPSMASRPSVARAAAAPAMPLQSSGMSSAGYTTGWGPNAEIPGWTPSMIGQSWSGGA